jgi:hypothetical protein
MNSLLHLLQAEGNSSLTLDLAQNSTLAKEQESNLAKWWDMLGERTRTLIKAKFDNYINYKRLQDILEIMLIKKGKCNLIVMKMFVVVTELEILCAVKSFLEVYPEYGELVEDLHFSQENLTKLRKMEKREIGTFQIRNGECIYQVKAVIVGSLLYFWQKDEEWILFSPDGSLILKAENYFEFCYKSLRWLR